LVECIHYDINWTDTQIRDILTTEELNFTINKKAKILARVDLIKLSFPGFKWKVALTALDHGIVAVMGYLVYHNS